MKLRILAALLLPVVIVIVMAQTSSHPGNSSSGGSGLPSQSTPGYLYSNGTVASWSDILTGSSGGFACASGQCDIVTAVVPRFGFAWTQTGAVNFTNSSKTAPNRVGAGSPVGRDNCTNQGETYFQTDAAAGSNSWACTAAGSPGTWALQGGGASAALKGPYALWGIGHQTNGGYNDATAAEAILFNLSASRTSGGIYFKVMSGGASTCGGGGTAGCGLNYAIASLPTTLTANPPTGSVIECQSATGIAGGNPDLGSPGSYHLPWVSGTAFSGGNCTLSAGPHILLQASEKTITLVALFDDNSIATIDSGINPYFFGYAFIVTGTSTTYAIGAPTGATFTAFTESRPYLELF